MKQIQAYILILTIFVTMFVGYLFPTIVAAEMDNYWVGKVVSIQGSVQARRAGTAEWVPVRLNDTYSFGDMVRVREQSRAAVVLRSGAILRLDQKTTIIFSASKQKETSLLDLLHGAAHFFSPTPRKLKVTTPFVNAAVGGTEFFVRVERNQTFLSVFEGRVAAINEAGSLVLASGQSAIARTGQVPVSQVVARPRDAVQWALYYPPVLDYQPADFSGASTTDWQAMVRKSIGFFWEGDLAGAFSSLKGIPDDIRDPRFFIYRATLHLSVGRVDDASADIERALAFDPSNGHAFALQSGHKTERSMPLTWQERPLTLPLNHLPQGWRFLMRNRRILTSRMRWPVSRKQSNSIRKTPWCGQGWRSCNSPWGISMKPSGLPGKLLA